MRKLYKVLDGNCKSCHGGNFYYDRPRFTLFGWEPGRWTPLVEKVTTCSSGYHLTEEPWRWMSDKVRFVFEAEGFGTSDREGDKVAFQSVRLLKPVSRLRVWLMSLGTGY